MSKLREGDIAIFNTESGGDINAGDFVTQIVTNKLFDYTTPPEDLISFEAYTNLVQDPTDLTTVNWSLLNGATAAADPDSIDGLPFTKLGSTTGIAQPNITQIITGLNDTAKKSTSWIIRNINTTGETTELHILQNGAVSVIKARVTINWDTQVVSMTTGSALDYEWIDSITVRVSIITLNGEGGGLTAWTYRIDPRITNGDSAQFIKATACQLVKNEEVFFPFVDGSRAKDVVDRASVMQGQFTIDMIIDPRFVFDTTINHRFIDWFIDSTHRFMMLYNVGIDKIRIRWEDGGTGQILDSQQFDDGSGLTLLNQRIRIIASIDLTTGDTTGSRFIVIPLESGAIAEDTIWSGNINAFTSTFPTLSTGHENELIQADSEFEYLRIYDGLMTAPIASNADADEAIDAISHKHIQTRNLEPAMDGGLESAVYLSLFGNDGSSYWANEYFTEDQKLTGLFIGFMVANPKTISTLNQAEEFALQDLQWFINSGIADIVDVTITSQSRQRIDLTVELKIDGDTLFQNTFQINWEFQINDPAHERIA